MRGWETNRQRAYLLTDIRPGSLAPSMYSRAPSMCSLHSPATPLHSPKRDVVIDHLPSSYSQCSGVRLVLHHGPLVQQVQQVLHVNHVRLNHPVKCGVWSVGRRVWGG